MANAKKVNGTISESSRRPPKKTNADRNSSITSYNGRQDGDDSDQEMGYASQTRQHTVQESDAGEITSLLIKPGGGRQKPRVGNQIVQINAT